MDEETQKIITAQMKKLPKDVRDAISSVDYKKNLQEIVKKGRLLIDKAGKLETETTFVMLGLEPLNDYVQNISRELEIPRERAVAIAHDADELIFKNIRESLRKMNDEIPPEAEEETESVDGQSRKIILDGVENPSNIGMKEGSVSVSALKSNSSNPEYPMEPLSKMVEIRKEISPEIPKEAMLPMKTLSQIIEKTPEPYHTNSSPIDDIVGEKLTKAVFVPKEKIIIEENTKLPPKPTHDPYRESIE